MFTKEQTNKFLYGKRVLVNYSDINTILTVYGYYLNSCSILNKGFIVLERDSLYAINGITQREQLLIPIDSIIDIKIYIGILNSFNTVL